MRDPKYNGVAGFALYIEDWMYVGNVLKRRVSDKLSDAAFRAAASTMGVDIEGEVTVEAIGLALGKKIKIESGVDLGNVLDGESVKDKLERVAIAAILNQYGIDAPATRDGLSQAVGVLVRRRMLEKISTGAAAGLLEDVGSKVEAAAVLAAIKRRSVPLLDTKKAAQNRERQANFRATHRRVRL